MRLLKGLLQIASTVANRGNVAVICWNTLGTPTWYVNGEKLDGEVTLGIGQETKSLLEINFSEFTHENSEKEKEGYIKEVTATVINTPARTTEIGDRQIVLDGADIPDFDFKAKKDYKKAVQEEKTYENADDDIVAYVPESVYGNIDSLRNKKVTIIFGEENIVALIVVEDDTVDPEYLTKYSIADEEITVGGEKYDLADNVEVVVNDVEIKGEYVLATAASRDGKLTAEEFAGITASKYTKAGEVYTKVTTYVANTVYYVFDDTNPLNVALKIILGTEVPTKAFDKKIEAELTLDDDEDVEKIDLFVSGTYLEFNTVETVATKTKTEKIETAAGTSITWDEDKYETKDYPRVYIDGVKSEVTDIEAGDVLTIFGELGITKNITVIYASRETVEGDVTRVKNKNQITIDGETYLTSAVDGKAFDLDGELKDLDAGDRIGDFDSIHGEEAILHLNVLGEYVLVDADSVDTDWQFAVVDNIYDVKEDEEDEDLYSQQLRLVMMDGTKVRNFKLVYDAADYEASTAAGITEKVEDNHVISANVAGGDKVPNPDAAKDGEALSTLVDKNTVIAFKANADGEIELDEVFAVDTTAVDNDDIDGFEFIALETNYNNINFDTKRIDYTVHVASVAGATGALEVVENDTAVPTATQIKINQVVGMAELPNAGDYVKAVTTRYKVTSDTKIADVATKEKIAWKDLVDEDDHKVTVNTLLVYEEDKTELSYVLALAKPAAVSDTQYALVVDATYTTSKTKTEAKLLGVDGKDYVYEYGDVDLVEGSLIAYTVSNNKMTLVDLFVDDDADNTSFVDLAAATDSATDSLLETGFAKGAYKVMTFDTDYLTYTDDDDKFPTLDERVVDVNVDDVIVVAYDDNELTFVKAEFDAETLEDEYVLHFNEGADGVELLVIIK